MPAGDAPAWPCAVTVRLPTLPNSLSGGGFWYTYSNGITGPGAAGTAPAVAPKELASMHRQYTSAPRPCEACGSMFVNVNGARFCSRDCRWLDKRLPLEDRFWRQVEKHEDGCWLWKGHLQNGYGRFLFGRGHTQKCIGAHRMAYQLLVGPIPDGLQLDHLCRNQACVNPAHLEPVTNRENMLRSNHPNAIVVRSGVCRRGHPRTPKNARMDRRGTTTCRECTNERARTRRAQRQLNKMAD